MFIREEQEFILKMLDEGKINAAEAEKLLIALNDNCCCDYKNGKKNFEHRLNKMCKCVHELKSNVCDYMNNKIKPKAKKKAQCLLEKTSIITKDWANKLKKSLDSDCDNNNNCDNNCGCNNDF